MANLNIKYNENGIDKVVVTNSSGDYSIITTATSITIKVDNGDSDYPNGYIVTTSSNGGNESQDITTVIGSSYSAKSIGYYKAGAVLSASTNTTSTNTNNTSLPSTGSIYIIAVVLITVLTTYTIVMVKGFNR